MQVTSLLSHINPSTFLEDYLEANGIEDVDSYLRPHEGCFDSCWDYPNMELAVRLLNVHVENNNTIGILADCDGDGQYSATIMYSFLKSLGITPIMFFHVGKEHGLRKSPNGDEDIVAQVIEKGIHLLIIPDASSNDAKECKQLRDYPLGVDVLILDHHEITVDNPYAVIVNHHLGAGLNTALSGTGVTAKFVEAYCERYNLPKPYYNDLVAASIISDVCDLRSLENRAYVEDGLNHLTHPTLKLMTEKLCRKGVNPEGLAWGTNPPINALSRGQNFEDKVTFFEAMVGNEKPEKALTVARRAHKIQTEETKRIMAEVEHSIDNSNKIIVAFTEPSNKNYIGLVANKIMSQYGKPVLLLREADTTTWSGSIRSPIPLASRINETKLAKCQGHEEACGIVIKKANLKKLLKWSQGLELSVEPDIHVTASLLPSEVNVRLCEICKDNKIMWGNGLPQPTFHFAVDLVPSSIQIFEKSTTTIKFTAQGMDFLKFMATKEEAEAFKTIIKNNKKVKIEVVATLETNEWMGKVTPQAIISLYEIHGNDEVNVTDDSWENYF